ncbi:Replication-associated protein [Araneus ventricosus]|uniref:Replication-associated protein n=1 Tax=Araneus ventricosus TaxID=182803 RepID=A0A4Y2KHH7_ARAVE|nr:Replication-associated protein [Araneus ventricosus]
MSRCNGWSFTSFICEPEPVFDPAVHEYLILGREVCPDTGRQHIQGYVYFKQRRRLPFCKKWLPQAHFEGSKGSPESNKVYCSKDGDFTEYGRLPRSKSGGSVFKDESGDIASIKENHPGIFLRYKTNIVSSIKFRTEELSESCGVWITGPPRCGKDYAVRELGDCFVKSLNKWLDGYTNQRHVLLPDVEPEHGKWLGYFLKIWSDRYPFTAEIKGSSMLIRPDMIY